MPFYEYQCSACGAQTEVLQKITDAPLKKCPECGKNQLVKLVSAPVFRLKGGGWYETDFKSDKDRKRNLVESDRDGGGEKKDDKPAESSSGGGKADSTPAASEVKAPKPEPARKAAKPAARTSARPAAKSKASKPGAARAGRK